MAETLNENEFGLLALSALMRHFTSEQLGAILGMHPAHAAARLGLAQRRAPAGPDGT